MNALLAPLLAALLLQDPARELLPETPKDWSFERLELPLSFAPDLDYEGLEEISLAPGMFDASSDSHWSYVLAIRLDGDHDVDAPFLRSFFEGYYRGLCRAVGEGKDLDLSSFAVSARRADGRYELDVQMVDPFVSGDPLRLRLEVDVLASPTATELFGIASAEAPDEGVWGELRAIRDRWAAARSTPFFLNHVYLVPDEETYAAIVGSEFLRAAFGANEERETVRADMSYTGVYFYGRRTYFEFLAPGSVASLAPGASGVGFGIEKPGGTEELERALRDEGVASFAGPRTRALDGVELPWFQILGISQPNTTARMSLFSMEYAPEFLAGWHAELPPAGGGIARRDVLGRYAASLGQTKLWEDGPLLDVAEVHLSLDDEERAHWLKLCGVLGYEISEAEGEWRCRAPQMSYVVRASEGPGGVTGLRLTLRRPVERAPLELGKAKLSFEGNTATLALKR